MRSNLELCRNLWWCWAPFLALFLIRQPNSDVLWFSFQLKLKFKFNAVKDFGFGGLRPQTPAFYFLLQRTTPPDPCIIFVTPGDFDPRLLFLTSRDYAHRPMPSLLYSGGLRPQTSILYFGGLRPQTPALYSLLRRTTTADPCILFFTPGNDAPRSLPSSLYVRGGGTTPQYPCLLFFTPGDYAPDFYL